ncbi:zinc-binding dehydrogenase [Kribbella deserti]|uniref:Zinc-binding dehydrogenase n=1 Tax=Kribbella deserti TaxID=1926257 RepID=A0ABV6QMG2_9ACTN
MHAIRLHEFGPAGNLRYEEAADPVPAAGQVRIKVEAAGVHLVDTVLRAGNAGGAPIAVPDLPTIPGREVAGTVDALGPGTDESWLGRRVVVHLGQVPGGYAELAVAAAEALHPIPEHLDAAEAVAIIGTGRTTMAVLADAHLGPDDVVLITAAAGGIGSLLVQTARNVGATVVGLAGGPAKVEQVRSLGAQIVIDYRDPDWPEQVKAELDGRSVTVILDGVGGEPGKAALDLLGVGGRIVWFGWSDGEPPTVTTSDIIARGLTVSWAIGPKMFQRPGGLRAFETAALTEAIEGRWKPLTTRFPLAKAADAHQALENRETTGKVVLIP